jgi:hypothetical protein
MAETITITKNDDGTFQVTESQDDPSAGDQPMNETAASLDEVLGLVQKALSDEVDPRQAAWNQEAAARDQPTHAAQPQPM